MKYKGKYTQNMKAQDFIDFSAKDIKEIVEEQKKRMRELTKKKIKKKLSKPYGKSYIGSRSVSVQGGIRKLGKLI